MVYQAEERLEDDGFTDPASFRKLFTVPVARGLYNEFRNRSRLTTGSASLKMNFEELRKAEKQFWTDYASAIPEKYASLNLYMRPFRELCRTCIITEEEIKSLTSLDLASFHGSCHSAERKALFEELNYLIPVSLKKAGLEIIRPEEIVGMNMAVIRKIARAIHARYMHEIKKQNSRGIPKKVMLAADFDELSEDIRQSNIENAMHIPAKLLAIGYRIRPARKGFKPMALHLDKTEVETMARVEHLRWSWEKRLNGWVSGEKKDEKNKVHPGLVGYDELDEEEKEKDRELVRLIPAILQDINYEAYAVAPGHLSKISYAIRPQSSINKLLEETNELGREIAALAESSPGIKERIKSIDEKIKLTLSEAEGSYNYARHIQKTFLPEDLYVRECFPDSFILFEPKDIVSGDFYLFSKIEDHIIFGLADCTGHGIPAALISTIGYGILDQAVNIMKIADPADSLQYLFRGIHRFLRRDIEETGVSDDMTIILCNLDTTTGVMSYSGIGNILWLVSGGKISGNLSSPVPGYGIMNGKYDFSSGNVHLLPGDTLYLCSDGFADQFGGNNHKRYTRRKLADYLQQISSYPLPEQADMLYAEFDQWRAEKNEDQTDDITIIGIRV